MIRRRILNNFILELNIVEFKQKNLIRSMLNFLYFIDVVMFDYMRSDSFTEPLFALMTKKTHPEEVLPFYSLSLTFLQVKSYLKE